MSLIRSMSLARRVRLPPKRTRPRMAVREELRRIWPRHRRWVKSHGCCVPGCCGTPIEFAHLRSAANAGKSQRPHDAFGVGLCLKHHREQHRGQISFEKKYNINLWELAREFVRRSPDKAMKESIKGIPEEQLLYHGKEA